MASFQAEPGDNAAEVPTRILVVQDEARPAIEMEDEEMCMAFPHLIVREAICFLSVFLVLALLSMFFNAPLEELANPLKTPNPAKAPWYFLGLQELLHYYPPLISGIILPGLVVVGLVGIPYFEVNIKREPLWESNRGLKFVCIWLAAFSIVAGLEMTAPHHVWSVVIPTLVIPVLMTSPLVLGSRGPVMGWLATRSLAFWNFTWFVTVAVVLTTIGVFFRGPYWAFTLPWKDGVF
jgi:hypothetical protein